MRQQLRAIFLSKMISTLSYKVYGPENKQIPENLQPVPLHSHERALCGVENALTPPYSKYNQVLHGTTGYNIPGIY